MSVNHIIKLLEFCLNSTSFTYQGQFYQQVEGAAMGSPLSPIVANIYMEKFEEEALATAPHPPSLWKRYVDDTFVIQKEEHSNEFLQHINSIEEKIKFTAESTRADGAMPFLDTLVTPRRDGSLETRVYRKPTHTNQYLQWDSHHAINNKYSIISTLLHRAKNICSNKELMGRRIQLHPQGIDIMQISKMGHQKNEVEARCTKNQAEQEKHPDKPQMSHNCSI